jgi:hypothetical protein
MDICTKQNNLLFGVPDEIWGVEPCEMGLYSLVQSGIPDDVQMSSIC